MADRSIAPAQQGCVNHIQQGILLRALNAFLSRGATGNIHNFVLSIYQNLHRASASFDVCLADCRDCDGAFACDCHSC